MPAALSLFTRGLSLDDYEETELLRRWHATYMEADNLNLRVGGAIRKEQERVSADLKVHCDKLGYDPVVGRPERQRGRVREKAMPVPLPVPGTELQSCIGVVYKIAGYARRASSTRLDLIVYTILGGNGEHIVRPVTHLFAGALQSGEVFVTWLDDPRGLKAAEPVPLNKRRTLTKQDRARDEHADPDATGNWVKPAGRY